MYYKTIILALIAALIGIYVIKRPISTDSWKCPLCCGEDFCPEMDKINLVYESFDDFSYNLVSVKNIYFARYKGRRVVLKKLAPERMFRFCTSDVLEILGRRVAHRFTRQQTSTMLTVNLEPLLLTLLEGYSNVPKLLGTCGFLIVEQYCGRTLNSFAGIEWQKRALLAGQLLEAAVNLTNHADLRVYLTDVSPDNIAVDDDLKVYFIDLEHAILKESCKVTTVHRSQFFDDADFYYSADGVCESSLSDHNIYSVCRLLLSGKSPWPMMSGGLLHSAPDRFQNLLGLVEECVDSTDRFAIAERLIRGLRDVNK